MKTYDPCGDGCDTGQAYCANCRCCPEHCQEFDACVNDTVHKPDPDALIMTADRLARWEAWEGEFADNGCEDADDTLRAYWKRGYLHALAAVARGEDLLALAAVAVADANEMILGEPEEEEDE